MTVVKLKHFSTSTQTTLNEEFQPAHPTLLPSTATYWFQWHKTSGFSTTARRRRLENRTEGSAAMVQTPTGKRRRWATLAGSHRWGSALASKGSRSMFFWCIDSIKEVRVRITGGIKSHVIMMHTRRKFISPSQDLGETVLQFHTTTLQFLRGESAELGWGPSCWVSVWDLQALYRDSSQVNTSVIVRQCPDFQCQDFLKCSWRHRNHLWLSLQILGFHSL